MTSHLLPRSASTAVTTFAAGISVWLLVLIALSTVPLDEGGRTGVYTPTGLLIATTEPNEPGIVFERQMLPR